MKHLTKRICALLLCLCLMAGFLPSGVWAEEEEVLQSTQINPLYDDDPTLAAWLEEPVFYALEDAPDPVLCAGPEEAALVMRQAMKDRQEILVLRMEETDPSHKTSAGFKAYTHDISENAVAHTGVPTEGDYLAYQYGGWHSSGAVTYDGVTQPNAYFLTITYTIQYYTDADQEAAMDYRTAQVLEELEISGLSELQKTRAIYDYICANVTYDHENLNISDYKLKYTAYAALMNGTAVCQGYAVLFYRLALMAGLDARVIAGTGGGGNHAWNIVRIGSRYYDVDSTWDAGKTSYQYYLRIDSTFGNHVRLAKLNTAAFHAEYPMAEKDYICAEHTPRAIPPVEPTCTSSGTTGGTQCAICPVTLTSPSYTPPLAHTPEEMPSTPSTCSVPGTSGGTRCSRCGITLEMGQPLPTLPHTAETIPGKKPTCTETGLTDGIRCKVCNAVLKPQITVTKADHTWEGYQVQTVSCDRDGVWTDVCTVCGETRDVITPMTGHRYSNGVCTVCKQPDPEFSIPIFRLYNPYTQEHLLSSDPAERDALLTSGWSLDGVAWNAPASGTNVYRLYNPYDDWHTYSTNQAEIDVLVKLGWTVDGAVSYSAESNALPIFRLFNPYVLMNYHMLTASADERDLLVSAGWVLEGIAWYCLK